MSFDSLVEAQPPVVVQRQTSPHSTDLGGIPDSTTLTNVATIRGRMVLASATQVALWKSEGIDADYKLDTKYLAIQNGDLLFIADPDYGDIRFEVKGGVGGKWYGAGNIKSFAAYPCKRIIKQGD